MSPCAQYATLNLAKSAKDEQPADFEVSSTKEPCFQVALLCLVPRRLRQKLRAEVSSRILVSWRQSPVMRRLPCFYCTAWACRILAQLPSPSMHHLSHVT